MIVCQKCGKSFPFWIKVNGKQKSLSGRKYCLECSPAGKHNTKKLNGEFRKDQKTPKCPCGETDPKKFYGHKKSSCGKCHNKYTKKIGHEKREFFIHEKGGKCLICGYNKYRGSLDFHHLNPSIKDKKFANMRSWNKEKIRKELKDCVLLCSNCHREVHGGATKIKNSA